MIFYFAVNNLLADYQGAWNKQSNKRACLSYSFTRSLKPIGYNIKLVKWLREQGNKIYLISNAANDLTMRGTYDWIKMYFPELEEDQIILTIGERKKWEQRKENGYLVDSSIEACNSWEGHGGQGAIYVKRGMACYDAIRNYFDGRSQILQ